MPHRTATYPAHVDGVQIDVASLEILKLSLLSSKDPGEIEKLLRASTTPGFFYLDVQEDSSKQALSELSDIYALTERYFCEGNESKGQDRGFVDVCRSCGDI